MYVLYDVLCISEPKSRPSVQSKVCARTNSHLFVEFGLNLYHFMLKREKLKGADYKPHLDPFVKVLADCLKSEYVKVQWQFIMKYFDFQETILIACL